MDTLKTNKQFAKFLGLTHKATKGGFAIKGIVVKYQNLNFHNDWNSLMEVVEKIENSNYVDEFVIKKCSVFGFNVLITPISYDTFNFFHCTLKDETKIQTVYNACLLFIEWYNEQNK